MHPGFTLFGNFPFLISLAIELEKEVSLGFPRVAISPLASLLYEPHVTINKIEFLYPFPVNP